MKKLLFSSLLLLCAAGGALLACLCYCAPDNTLSRYPEWESEKAALQQGLAGAVSYLHSSPALAGGGLNLGAWFGHQKLRLRETWTGFPHLTFWLWSHGQSNLTVVAEAADGSPSVAIRLSSTSYHPSAFLTVSPEGLFTAKRALPYVLRDQAWAPVEFKREGDTLLVIAEGVVRGREKIPPGARRLVFYGASIESSIQLRDLRIDEPGKSYSQSFDRKFAAGFPLGLFLAAAFTLGLALAAIARWQDFGAAVLTGFSLLLAGSLAYEAEIFFFLPRYSPTVDLAGYFSPIESRPNALKRLGELSPSGPNVALWLGGSQAWGAGSSRFDRSAFSRLKATVETAARGRVEWVNGAISGAKVLDLVEPLERVAQRRKLAAVVLMAGGNDSFLPGFGERLKLLVARARSLGARVFLIAEPYEPSELEIGPRSQREMEQFAKAEGLPFLSIQPQFDRHSDDGFIWWDHIHLTDLGAAMEAGYVREELRAFFATLPVEGEHAGS